MNPADPLAPAVNAPPRRLEPWTTVPGHLVARDRPFCSCGASAPRKWRDGASDWREEHLANAWPVLVERMQGEQHAEWMGRISEAYVAASFEEQQLRQRDGIDPQFDPARGTP